eukprot:gene11279-4091_t
MFQTYSHQVAGHSSKKKKKDLGLLVKDDFVYKKKEEKEFNFYEEKVKKIENIVKFIPRYFGVFEIENEEYLTLENLTFNFEQPCILDLKIGRKTYEPTAKKEKIEYEISKYPQQKEIGFRFSGMKIFNGQEEYTHYDQFFGRSITEDKLEDAFKLFFSQANSNIITKFLTILKEIENLFENDQKEYKFISSSLLFIYESQNHQLKNDQIVLKMIDFCHVIHQEESSSIDEDYLHGIKNLIKILKKIKII